MKTFDRSTAVLIDSMGTDLTTVNAARVSFSKTSEFEPEGGLKHSDEKLISYLAKHNHWTPFGHIQLQFRCKAPVFIARQMVKHQVGLVWNEVSRRYVDDEPEFYWPKWRARPDGSIKQGSGDDLAYQGYAQAYYTDAVKDALFAYNALLEEGVAPEQARMVLPLSHATEWVWTGSLVAFARVCKLRLDSHAQAECHALAEDIAKGCEKVAPISFKALMGN